MKKLPFILALLAPLFFAFCQPQPEEDLLPGQQKYQNLIVVTLDGLDWREVYEEADVLNLKYLEDKADLYGNRNLGNQVDVANKSMQSYPGYAEIFTGNTSGTESNRHSNSPHSTVLEFVNKQAGYEDLNVMSVGMSEFPEFLFANGSFPVITPRYAKFRGREFKDPLGNTDFLTDKEINKVIDVETALGEIFAEAMLMKSKIHSYGKGENNEEGELLIYLFGKKLLQKVRPKVMYMSFVMTDHFAHLGEWNDYIYSAKNVGVYLRDLIEFVNSDENYRNKTAILVTTDHGRSKSNFKNHSAESFFILITPHTGKGVIRSSNQYYNEQLAQTMSSLLGFKYSDAHSIAPPIDLD